MTLTYITPDRIPYEYDILKIRLLVLGSYRTLFLCKIVLKVQKNKKIQDQCIMLGPSGSYSAPNASPTINVFSHAACMQMGPQDPRTVHVDGAV